MSEKNGRIEVATKLVEMLSVVVGVIVSVNTIVGGVHSASEARAKEAQARIDEAKRYQDQRADDARKQRIEAAKTFLELRQERYSEIVKTVAILANPQGHSAEEKDKAKARFMDLYIAELSMVESDEVEDAMIDFLRSIDGNWKGFSPEQRKAYDLSHALRNSLVKSWGVDEAVVDNPRRGN